MPVVGGLLKGLFAPLVGAQLILQNRKAMAFTLAPGVIGVSLFITSLYFGAYELFSYLKEMAGGYLGEAWYAGVLGILFSIFGSVSAFFILLLVLYVCYSVLSGPFFSFLTEEVYKKKSPKKLKANSSPLMIRMFYLSLLKILVFLPIGILAFFLSFFPPFSLVAYSLIFLMIAFDSMDYAFETDHLNLGERFTFFKAKFPVFVGLAITLGAMSLLPGLLFLVFPLFVAGSTKLYVDLSGEEC